MAQPQHLGKSFGQAYDALIAAVFGGKPPPIRPAHVRQFIRRSNGAWEEWGSKYLLSDEDLYDGEALLTWEVQS